ncbi:MAG: SpoIIE family protein phosphatase [Planctomycetota bacterium]|jgi:serine phosphatase RsbU (regulator of sigma subunit)
MQIIAAPTEYTGPRRFAYSTDDQPITIGRSSSSELCITDARISRSHLLMEYKNDAWQVMDLGSSHGTRVNGVLLDPGIPTVIADGDRLRLGQTRIDVGDESTRAGHGTTVIRDANPAEQARTVAPESMRGLRQDRLELLISASELFGTATKMDELHERAARFLAGAMNTGRALIVREGPDNSVDVLGWHDANQEGAEPPPVSSSLIRLASSGQIAELTGASPGANYGQSIMSLGIRSAICAPIVLDDAPEAYLYLDSRDQERALADDAATFCRAVTQVYRLAMLNLQRKELEKRQRVLSQDLEAARDAQRCLMPDEGLHVPGVEFAYSYTPGRMVAGDLFDVIELDDNRVGLFLGDVMGKGAGAAVAMTAMQTWLCAGMHKMLDPTDFVGKASSFCFQTFQGARFVTLWFGVLDPEERKVTFVDAGHGFCIHIPAGREPMVITTTGGPPLGLLPDAEYPSDTLSVGPGDRVVLFSDGVVEQFNPAHTEQFGMTRALDQLVQSDSAQKDVELLEKAVREYSGSGTQTDDLTIASIKFD